jgi:hypothetical protein
MAYVFAHDGECQFSGRWTTITAARAFDPLILQVPIEATHWIRFTAGATADLAVHEVVTGGTGSGTAVVVAQIIEQGTAGGSSSAGVLLLRNLSWLATTVVGVDFVATEVLTGGTSTGTVVASGPVQRIISHAPAKTLLITCQTATLQFSYSGLDPTATAGTDEGMQLVSGGNFLLRGPHNIKKFKAINAVNGSGSVMKYALHY